MNPPVTVSLIMPYRGREKHLQTQLEWWHHPAQRRLWNQVEVLLIELTETPAPPLAEHGEHSPIRYVHCPCKGVFHKTRALNLGLSLAQGMFVVPYDVDLIPIGSTLTRHLAIAHQATPLLVTGYRVMADQDHLTVEQLPDAVKHSQIAPEDRPTALRKQLLSHEKFGVVPFFQRDRLMAIGGWDEQFMGWGAEDQDLIERYLQGEYALCRCPELVYLHLFHGPDANWSETQFTEQNRHYYYAKASQDRGRSYREEMRAISANRVRDETI